MCPLTLGGSSHAAPTTFADLMDFLAARPQPALVFYDGSAADPSARVELSGRVLANWATKLIGLLTDEHDLDAGEKLLIDMAPHWKAAALGLAAGAVGAEVEFTGTEAALSSGEVGASQSGLAVVATERPVEWAEGSAVAGAGLVAVSLGMVDESFPEATGQDLPAWVTDLSAEARQHPDQLLSPLPPVALPPASPSSTDGPLLVTQWGPASFAQMLGTWAAGGVVVMYRGPEGGQAWAQMLRNEGLSSESR